MWFYWSQQWWQAIAEQQLRWFKLWCSLPSYTQSASVGGDVSQNTQLAEAAPMPSTMPHVAHTAQRHAVSAYRSAPLVLNGRSNIFSLPLR